MTAIVLSKDSEGQKLYRYTGIIAMITALYQVKLIRRNNKIVSLDKELIINIMLEDLDKMTRDELLELLGFLANVRNSEYVADQMMQEECDKLIELVKKDIEDKYYKLGDI